MRLIFQVHRDNIQCRRSFRQHAWLYFARLGWAGLGAWMGAASAPPGPGLSRAPPMALSAAPVARRQSGGAAQSGRSGEGRGRAGGREGGSEAAASSQRWGRGGGRRGSSPITEPQPSELAAPCGRRRVSECGRGRRVKCEARLPPESTSLQTSPCTFPAHPVFLPGPVSGPHRGACGLAQDGRGGGGGGR